MTHPSLGETIGGRFVLERAVGVGGMGMVFEATDRLGGTVALKLIHGQTELDRRRFVREASVLMQVQHPAVVGYVDHGETPDGRCYLAMQWLEGEDLLRRLRRQALSLEEVVQLGGRVAEGLSALHAAGVVHRDLKPGNLLLVDGHASRTMLLDLGIARLSATRFDLTAMTAPGALVGTPAYVAPEQARGRAVDPRTDLYSLGVVLWECLAHQRAFAGDDMMAILARVLFEPIPSLAERVAGIPEDLAALVTQMTDKEPDERPADAAEVAARLRSIGQAPQQRLTRGRLSVMSALEVRIATVVVVTPPDSDGVGSGETWSPDEATAARGRLSPLAKRFGLRVEAFPDGTLVAVVDGTRAPTDAAVRAARFARAVRQPSPGSEVVVCTGRVMAIELPVGEAIKHASTLLENAEPDRVRIDEATANLVKTRFEIEREGDRLWLGDDRVATSRVSLPPSECVGRTRELALLRATFEECADEPCARAVLVLGEPGLGKTRLADEALRELAPRAHLLPGRGDPVRRDAAYGVLAPAVRGLLGIEDATSLAEARAQLRAAVDRFGGVGFTQPAERVAAMLGELAGVPFDEVSELREDSLALGDLVRSTFVEYVAALSTQRVVLFVVDDLQWADRPSVALLDDCLRVLEQRPVMVLALARPEADERFARLFQGRDLARLALSGLSRAASERLARGVGLELDDDAIAQVVERAQGNPFFLEELARAAERGDALPRTVLASVQARLDALEPQARLVLRAASVLGASFWGEAVERMVGAEREGIDVKGWLRSLAQAGLVSRVARGRLEESDEYVFRHPLVREACYAMLTHDDRRRGHRNAARWLEARADADPAALAYHFEAAGDGGSAARHRLAAAQRAIRADDLSGLRAHVAAIGEEEPEIRLHAGVLEGEALIWRGGSAEAYAAARAALDTLDAGAPQWLHALGVLVDAASGIGPTAEVAPYVETLLDDVPVEPAVARVLARLSTPLRLLDRSDLAKRCAERAASIDAGDEPLLEGRRAENAAMTALAEGDTVGAVAAFAESAEAFARAGAERWAVAMRNNHASKLLELGQAKAARAALAQTRSVASAQGFTYHWAFAALLEGLALQLDAEDAVDVLKEAVEALHALGDHRLESAARSALAEAWADRGDLDSAAAEAALAAGLVPEAIGARAAALAVQARIALDRGDVEAALTFVERARVLADVEPMLDRVRYLDWIEARALVAAGRPDEAKARAESAWREVDANAARLTDNRMRQTFLTAVPEHRGLAAILRALG